MKGINNTIFAIVYCKLLDNAIDRSNAAYKAQISSCVTLQEYTMAKAARQQLSDVELQERIKEEEKSFRVLGMVSDQTRCPMSGCCRERGQDQHWCCELCNGSNGLMHTKECEHRHQRRLTIKGKQSDAIHMKLDRLLTKEDLVAMKVLAGTPADFGKAMSESSGGLELDQELVDRINEAYAKKDPGVASSAGAAGVTDGDAGGADHEMGASDANPRVGAPDGGADSGPRLANPVEGRSGGADGAAGATGQGVPTKGATEVIKKVSPMVATANRLKYGTTVLRKALMKANCKRLYGRKQEVIKDWWQCKQANKGFAMPSDEVAIDHQLPLTGT